MDFEKGHAGRPAAAGALQVHRLCQVLRNWDRRIASAQTGRHTQNSMFEHVS